ncbi:alpha/beta-hydrolase [Lactarius hatsudake]|nr:alpha/beta-hydrolase [Lactarius hatsudake]
MIGAEGFGELSANYVHQRSAAKGAIPLLFIHGCTSSPVSSRPPRRAITWRRVRKLPRGDEVTAIPDGGFHPSFHVVAPSLPVFAWSEGVLENGFRAEHYTELTLTAASKYSPKYVKASHSNMPICDPPSFCENPITLLQSSFTARERQFPAHTGNFFKNGRGYSAGQATRPQTLGFSLADVGLLAWIYEKLITSYPWTNDKVLMWISIYWFSRAGLALADQVAKIVFESEHEVVGHFAAYEQPEALVGDLRKMFGKFGPAAGVVLGCAGY